MRWQKTLSSPAPVTLTTLVYVPDAEGYWSESPRVLARCLDSLRQTTPRPYELVVLDNGSCREVRDDLVARFERGDVDQLFLSRRNLGKVGGWNLLFDAAAGDTIVYFDSDVLFLPGWFEASRRVLEAFPEAAMVTAQPIAGDLSLHCDATLGGAAADPTVGVREGADLIPERFVRSQRLGLGESEESQAARLVGRRDIELRRRDVTAYVSASHFQFMTRREVLERVFPLPTHIPLGDDAAFDQRLDDEGFWRLSTTDYLVHHMGNRSPDFAVELPWWSGDGRQEPAADGESDERRGGRSRWQRRLLESERVRHWLKRVHRASYRWLYPDG